MTSSIELAAIKFALSVLDKSIADTEIDERGILKEMIRDFANGDRQRRLEMMDTIMSHLSKGEEVGMELEPLLSP